MYSLRRLVSMASLLVCLAAVAPAHANTNTDTQVWRVDLRGGERHNLLTTSSLRLTEDVHSRQVPAALSDFQRWGSFTSATYDAGRAIRLVEFDMRARLSSDALLLLELRGSGNGQHWAEWLPVEPAQALPLDPPARYLQVRATLLARSQSPQLEALQLRLTPARGTAQYQAQLATAIAPTYRIFATREGLVGHRTANGHIIQPRDRFVALPSFRSLSTRGNYEYQVRVSYKGRSVVLPVWDVGPWNVRDNYWSQSREQWGDLPTGLPQAQAAYLDGYNNGRDGWGRRINLPNGIDIADGAFWDDLGMIESDWVEVSFLWLGADPGAPGARLISTQTQPVPPLQAGAAAVDDSGPDFQRSQAEWYIAECGLNGGHTWTYSTNDPAQSSHRGRWVPALPAAGFYEVQVYIPACGLPATSNARYRVVHSGAVTELSIDQQALAGQWVRLGVWHFGPGEGAIELSDLSSEQLRSVRFDAVQWIMVSDTTAPSARVNAIQRRADGSYLVRWSGVDDLTGVASFDVQVRRLPDGEWSDWIVGGGMSEAAFVPADQSALAFRARARDWAGNLQAWGPGDLDTSAATLP